MDDTLFRKRAITLEESFFAQQNKQLIARLKEEAARKEQRKLLAEALQIENENVLDHLLELELSAECILAFSLVPLVEVAWADGSVAAKERDAILKAACEHGVEEGSISCELLDSWLLQQPPDALLDAWKGYVGALKDSLDQQEMQALAAKMLDRARAVAEAAGGFLGLGSKISRREQAMLEELEKALA